MTLLKLGVVITYYLMALFHFVEPLQGKASHLTCIYSHFGGMTD